jgi:2-C-methyl-D-erythritol 2,4-cyclodiphosphate synthase
MFRIGSGFDVHAFDDGRRLIIGGVEIPFEKGLSGHSDADVLVHAVMDALLGAVAGGDIGMRFPDTNARYRDADSLALLSELFSDAVFADWQIANIDSIILAERPRMSPHFPAMRSKIAGALGISESVVSVKATTTEKLGFCGRGEGIAAMATVLLQSNKTKEI